MSRVRPRYSRREVFFLIFAGIAGLVMLAAFISMNLAVLRNLGTGGDLLLPWKGARALFFEQAEPYAGQTANFVQTQVYGREAQRGENPYILKTPAFLLVLFFPLSVFGDAAAARAVFLLASEMAFLLLLFFSLLLADWQPRWLFLAAFFILSALGLYGLWSLMQGSPALILGLLYAGTLLALRSERDELAGLLLALSFHHWETGGAFILFILIWAFSQRRWRVMTGLFMALFILLALSFFIYPAWIEPWLRTNLADLQWHYGFSPVSILPNFWPEYGTQAGRAVSAFLWGLLAIEWNSARRSDFRRVYWAACLSLAASPLLGWKGEVQDLAVLILPFAFILAIVRERWKAGYLVGALVLISALLVPWGLLLGTYLSAAMQRVLIYALPPVFTIVGLYWIRWWALRPARTWLERASIPEYK